MPTAACEQAQEPKAWYDTALARARAEHDMPESHDRLAEDPIRDLEQDLNERRSAYEQTVWERAVNKGPTREERELLALADGASPQVRNRIKEIVVEETHAPHPGRG